MGLWSRKTKWTNLGNGFGGRAVGDCHVRSFNTMTTRVDDPAFAALPRSLQRRIDGAFRRAIGKAPPRKRRRLDNDGLHDQPPDSLIPDDSMEGGFIPPDPNALEGGFLLDEQGTGGGFIVDGDDEDGGFILEPSPPRPGPSTSAASLAHDSEVQGEEDSDSDSHIPLSLIPTALQILDLPPDDEQVLLVFKNAASGWTSNSISTRRSLRAAGPTEEAVSLRDWRAVCSVLLEPDVQGGFDEEDNGMDQDRDVRMSDGSNGDSGGSSEEYAESDPGEESDEQYLDDDYSDTPAKRRSTRRKITRGKDGFDESDDFDTEAKKRRPLTARQKEVSRQAFTMFLPPGSTHGDLEKQRITISDLVRVSKELNEKITYDQVGRFFLNLSGR